MKISALIIEDAIPMTIVLEHTLKELGIEVVGAAKTGEEALKLLETNSPNLITIDTVLPDMTGLEVLKKIKESNQEVKTIFISAAGSHSLIDEAMELGADGYILKPFDAEKLKAELNRLF